VSKFFREEKMKVLLITMILFFLLITILIFSIFSFIVLNRKKIINFLKTKINSFNTLVNYEERLSTLEETTNFLNYEVAKINEKRRNDVFFNPNNYFTTSSFDLNSFNYQWSFYNEGNFLLSDKNFKKNIKLTLSQYIDEKPEFFKNKKIIDVGAGSGRFSYGLLSLGAEVTAIEPTKDGCNQILSSCEEYSNKLTIQQKNILQDDLPNNFDVVFCYGVVHHTGNTYLAMKKACDCAKSGGKVFFMIYGYPSSKIEFFELNNYEYWRKKLRNMQFDKKIQELKKHFSRDIIHTLFDATSPKENDLLRYEEVVEILEGFGIYNIKKTFESRNIHIIGYKK
jgi:SAM-dependent methyltransferase